MPVKSDIRTNDNIHKIARGEGDGHTTACLLDHNYINNYYSQLVI